MGITRFYNPSTSAYQSQFVPTELPVDLMVRTLGAKQQQADLAMAKAVELGNFKQRALPGYDTEYTKGITDELEAFTAKSSSVDRTSPEYQREYLQLINKIKKDEGLKAVSASVAQHDAYTARREELIKKGGDAWTPTMENEYKHRYGIYTAKGGKGYTGDIQLGDPLTLEGVNVIEDTGKIFSHLSSSGYDNAVKTAAGTAYKKSWEGISDPVIRATVKKHYDQWSNTPAYRQLYQEKRQTLGNSLGQPLVNTVYDSLPDDEKAAIDAKMNEVMSREFYEIGTLYEHQKTGSGLAEAQNTDRGRLEEKLKDAPVIIPTNEKVTTIEASAADRMTKINELKKQGQVAWTALAVDQKRVKNGLPSAYSTEELSNLKEKANSLKREKDQLILENDNDYNKIFAAQVVKHGAEFAGHTEKQLDLMDQLKDLLPADEFIALKNNLVLTPSLTSKEKEYEFLKITSKLRMFGKGNISVIAGKLWDLEEKKTDSILERTNDLWESEYNKPKTTKTIEPAGVTIRTDANSNAAAVDKDIMSNPSSWDITTQEGKPLILGKNTTIIGSKTNSAADMTGMFNTSVQVRRPKRDTNGGVVLDAKKSIVYEDVWINAKATPVNEDTKRWINNNLAQEQFELADQKEAGGFHNEAELAYKHAVSLNKNSLSTQIDAFIKSNISETTVSTNVKMPSGSAITEIYLEKIKNSDAIILKYGNIEVQLSDRSKVDAYIQDLTMPKI